MNENNECEQLPLVNSFGPASGTNGTKISLFGSNFVDVNLVCKFDDIMVPAFFNSSNKITCEAPPNDPGSIVNITLFIDNNEVVSTSPFKFFYQGRTHFVGISDVIQGPCNNCVNGYCVSGICVCKENYTGIDCLNSSLMPSIIKTNETSIEFVDFTSQNPIVANIDSPQYKLTNYPEEYYETITFNENTGNAH